MEGKDWRSYDWYGSVWKIISLDSKWNILWLSNISIKMESMDHITSHVYGGIFEHKTMASKNLPLKVINPGVSTILFLPNFRWLKSFQSCQGSTWKCSKWACAVYIKWCKGGRRTYSIIEAKWGKRNWYNWYTDTIKTEFGKKLFSMYFERGKEVNEKKLRLNLLHLWNRSVKKKLRLNLLDLWNRSVKKIYSFNLLRIKETLQLLQGWG